MSSEKPTATIESTFIRTPKQLGRKSIGALLARSGTHIPIVLHTLIEVAGASKAEVAEWTGLTRGRIGHYLNLKEPVPEDRERQFYEILRDYTEVYEETLADFHEDPKNFFEEKAVVPEAVPVARAIVKACRKVLDKYEAEHQPKDDADEGEAT